MLGNEGLEQSQIAPVAETVTVSAHDGPAAAQAFYGNLVNRFASPLRAAEETRFSDVYSDYRELLEAQSWLMLLAKDYFDENGGV